jgi:NADH-quinone oxidoreductase subunit N
MLVGAFGALKQTRIKRFLAYTSVNQVGFLSLGIASCSTTGLSAIFLYLIIYIFMNIIFFSTLLNTEHIVTQKSLVYLSDFYSYSQYNSKGSKALVLTLMSMSGLPPLGGFFAKLYLYLAILEARLDFIFFSSLLISVYSTYYYLSLVRHVLFEKCLNLKVYYCINNAYTKNLVNFSAFVIIFYPIIVKVSVVWWFLKACF